MIPVSTGPEPAALTTKRPGRVAAVKALYEAGELKSTDFDGYAFVKDQLWKAQYYKCCYCEMREQSSRNDVEHYRPKTVADRRPGSAEAHGYYWLAWSWENLFFSCRVCNQSPYKVSKFPLALGSGVLAPHAAPPGPEHPLLIHPASENGIRHIQYRQSASGKWTATPRGGSEKGAHTIRVCGLDRAPMQDLYTDHVKREVRGRARLVVERMDANDRDGVRRAWAAASKALLLHTAPFVGLSYDALAELVPRTKRSDFRLRLLRGKRP